MYIGIYNLVSIKVLLYSPVSKTGMLTAMRRQREIDLIDKKKRPSILWMPEVLDQSFGIR